MSTPPIPRATSACRLAHIAAVVLAMNGIALHASGPPQATGASGDGSPVAVQAPPVDGYVVGRATPPATSGKARLDLTLDQAIARALDKNLNLVAARYNPQSADYQLLAARAVFAPTFTSAYGYQSQDNGNNNNLQKDTVTTTSFQQFSGGASMPLPWYGASVTATFNNIRTFTNSSETILNPAFGSTLTLQFTQPLWQGFRIDANRNAIRVLQIQRQITDTQLVATIENTKASVRTAYWNLKQAIEQIDIEQGSLDLAVQLLADNRARLVVGTVEQIDLVQNQASIAAAEEALLSARVSWQNAELTLDQLLASGVEDAIYTCTINPTEQPVLTPRSVDIPGAVRTALSGRTDLVEARRSLDVSRMNLDLDKDLTRPGLTLVAGYSATGQGGTAVSQGSALGAGTGYAGALSQLFEFRVPTWQTQFTFTYPLFFAAAKANMAGAQVGIEQALAQLRASELAVAAAVTTAGLGVENSYAQYEAAQAARTAQERTTQAEETRYAVGTSTNYNVVQQENALTLARLTELQQMIAYLQAAAQFDLVQRVGSQ